MSGQRFHTSWTRVGGLNMDLPDEATFKRMVKKFVDEDMPQAAADVEALLNKNRIFVDRTQGGRDYQPGGGDRLELIRADGAGKRRATGYPQG